MTDTVIDRLHGMGIAVQDRRGTLPVRDGVAPYGTRDLSMLKWQVYHHTGATGTPDCDAVAAYHTGDSCPTKYPAIAYWAFVNVDGTAHICHDVETVTWSQGTGSPATIMGVGSNNYFGLAVCFSGADPNRWQIKTLQGIARAVDMALGTPLERKPHCMVSRNNAGEPLTECPGDQWQEWIPQL